VGGCARALQCAYVHLEYLGTIFSGSLCRHNNNNVTLQSYFMCEITLHVAQIVNTEQLQHYTLETWFVAGI